MEKVAIFTWMFSGPITLALTACLWIATRTSWAGISATTMTAHRVAQVFTLLLGIIGALETYALFLWSYDIKGH